mmetsp:Transcript_28593/g.63833  ORF Transcript_28593/g.63833 Transcript_28593/m.63833 type:complete len:290 (-) Transcript_28593:186-1055(-)
MARFLATSWSMPACCSLGRGGRFFQARVTPTPKLEWARRVLKVGPHASKSQVKEAYRTMAVASHPDLRKPEDKAEATKRFRRCTEAYALLRDSCSGPSLPRSNSRPAASWGGPSKDYNHDWQGDGRGGFGSRAHGGGFGPGSGREDSYERLFRDTFGSLSDGQVFPSHGLQILTPSSPPPLFGANRSGAWHSCYQSHITCFPLFFSSKVLQAIEGKHVGETSGMAMLSLRRIRRSMVGARAGNNDGAGAVCPWAASGEGPTPAASHAWRSAHGDKPDARWPWKPKGVSC